MRATKKTNKIKTWLKKSFFYPLKWTCFFDMFFYLPKLTGFFSKIGNNLRALGRKKHMVFGNTRPKCNARAHLKPRKKHSGLSLHSYNCPGEGASNCGSDAREPTEFWVFCVALHARLRLRAGIFRQWSNSEFDNQRTRFALVCFALQSNVKST